MTPSTLPPGGSETILLVEDEATVREVTRKLLTRLGYSVLEASDGQEGLEIFGTDGDRVDLVITDVVMPTLTGTEMAARLREENPRLPVLFVSGYASRELGEAPGEPPEPFLPKPFTLLDLATAVRSALDGG